MEKRKISWRKKAKKDFENIIEYISDDSPQNAIKVYNRVMSKIILIPEFPKMHRADIYKIRNDGSFRAFEQDHIRISYRIKTDEIRIVRVRHTSMQPFEY